jgi:hypothetical protein
MANFPGQEFPTFTKKMKLLKHDVLEAFFNLATKQKEEHKLSTHTAVSVVLSFKEILKNQDQRFCKVNRAMAYFDIKAMSRFFAVDCTLFFRNGVQPMNRPVVPSAIRDQRQKSK